MAQHVAVEPVMTQSTGHMEAIRHHPPSLQLLEVVDRSAVMDAVTVGLVLMQPPRSN